MKKSKIVFLAIIIIFMIFWSIFLYKITPSKIVGKIGLSNSYLLLIFVSLLGGTSILLPFPYYLFTMSLGAAGLNPFLLGLCAGIGLLIGDATSYYISYQVHNITPSKYSKGFQKFFMHATKQNSFLFPFLVFLYASLIPLSDDLITMPSGFAKYPFWRLAIPLGLGKIVFNTLLAFSGLYSWSLLFK